MMMSDIEVLSEFAQVLKRYEQTLEAVERSTKPAASQILEVLIARDAVRAALNDEIRENASSIARLAELDEKLQAQAKAIGTCPKLKQWQESLTPPETDWWWYIEAPPVKSPWDRWDWMLDALTAGALLLTGSFMVSTLQAFSSSGLSWQETFGTIIQGAGLAVLSRGALTQDGSQKVKQILKSMGLPSHLHSEATFVVSLALLAGAYSLNTSLPKFGERSFEEGLELYDRGLLTEAQERYLQALQFKSDDAQYNVALGEIYESLADVDLAMEQYHKAVEKGEPKGFNHAGRVYIQKGDPIRAEAFLRMGLQRGCGTVSRLYRELGRERQGETRCLMATPL
ncbi:MAG: hypothetical protein HC925_08040 [Coleofasciculaceae cyanobacterium SM2_3_26]|nr:hypothetical protein [Coleofasciculaceae cyanobacterium SM2_3_26]